MQTHPAQQPTPPALSFYDRLAAAAPPSVSFAHVRSKRRRRALEIEQHLRLLADLDSALAPILDDYIKSFAAQGKARHGAARDTVFEALQATSAEMPLTLEELYEDTRLSVKTIWRVLQQLIAKGLVSVRSRPRSEGANGVRGGSRNPQAMFYLLHSQGGMV